MHRTRDNQLLCMAAFAFASVVLAGCRGGETPTDDGAVILQPAPGAVFGPGQLIAFVGEADPDLGSVISVTWTSSLNGVFGEDFVVFTTILMSGAHRITFTVEYPDHTASTTINILVGAGVQE